MGKEVEWDIRSLGRSVMSLYDETKTRIRVDYDLSEEFVVKEGLHQGSVLLFLSSQLW